ncbi:hypothetical protein NQ315_003115 [Exocentrus adspersus]|uniref:Ionotropic receptor n=1 Tax=Exocentrus adspersus TaxID=1586481 RepID=A0AAV8W4G7_9CUCU|nr:hypothetical protein NQ315_003115 [Exocentrus adspersus]
MEVETFSRLEDARVSLSECIVYASKTYFHSSFNTIMYSTSVPNINTNLVSARGLSDIVLPRLNVDLSLTLMIQNLARPHQTFIQSFEKVSYYIIRINKRKGFAGRIKKLKAFPSWNAHAKFLVVFVTLFDDPEVVAGDTIKTLWEYNAINFAILIADKENSTNINVYTWNPNQRICSANFTKATVMGTCAFGKARKNAVWFSNKQLKRIYSNCPVKVSHYDKSLGIEVNLMNMIADIANLTIVYEKTSFPHRGTVYDNYSTTGDFTLLKENKVDVLLGGYFKTVIRDMLFDTCQTCMYESLIWCVPHEPIIVDFKNMFSVFNTELWLVVFLNYLITSFCMWYTSIHRTDEYLFYNYLSSSLLNNFLVLLGFSVNILPRTTRVRCFIFTSIAFSLILTTLFNTYLTSILASATYKEKYGTMEQIYKFNLTTYFVRNYKMFFDKGPTEINNVPLATIMEKWKDCPSDFHCTDIMIKKKDTALCITRFHLNYKESKENWKKKANVYCFNTPVMSLQKNLVMRKGFQLYSTFCSIISRIASAGFLVKWERDVLEKKIDDGEGFDRLENQLIGFGDLLPTFYMLGIGYALSTVVFVIELMLNANRKRSEGSK